MKEGRKGRRNEWEESKEGRKEGTKEKWNFIITFFPSNCLLRLSQARRRRWINQKGDEGRRKKEWKNSWGQRPCQHCVSACASFSPFPQTAFCNFHPRKEPKRKKWKKLREAKRRTKERRGRNDRGRTNYKRKEMNILSIPCVSASLPPSPPFCFASSPRFISFSTFECNQIQPLTCLSSS